MQFRLLEDFPQVTKVQCPDLEGMLTAGRPSGRWFERRIHEMVLPYRSKNRRDRPLS